MENCWNEGDWQLRTNSQFVFLMFVCVCVEVFKFMQLVKEKFGVVGVMVMCSFQYKSGRQSFYGSVTARQNCPFLDCEFWTQSCEILFHFV